MAKSEGELLRCLGRQHGRRPALEAPDEPIADRYAVAAKAKMNGGKAKGARTRFFGNDVIAVRRARPAKQRVGDCPARHANHVSIGLSLRRNSQHRSQPSVTTSSSRCTSHGPDEGASVLGPRLGGGGGGRRTKSRISVAHSWHVGSLHISGVCPGGAEDLKSSKWEDSLASTRSWTQEYSRSATAAINEHFDRINDLLYHQKDNGMKEQQHYECLLWSSNFAHIRVRGDCIEGCGNGVQFVPAPLPQHDATSSLRRFSRTHFLQSREKPTTSKGLTAFGTAMSLLEVTEWDVNNPQLEEVFAADGIVEDYLAFDSKEDRVGMEPGKPRRRRGSNLDLEDVQAITLSTCRRASALVEVVDQVLTVLKFTTTPLAKVLRRKFELFRTAITGMAPAVPLGKRPVKARRRPPLQHISLDDIPISPSVPIGYHPAAAYRPELNAKDLPKLMMIKSCPLRHRTESSTQLIREETPPAVTGFSGHRSSQPLSMHKLLGLQIARLGFGDVALPGSVSDPQDEPTPIASAHGEPQESRHTGTGHGQRADAQHCEQAMSAFGIPQARPAFAAPATQDLGPLQIATTSGSIKAISSPKKRGLLKPLERTKTPLPAQMDMDVTRQVLRGHKLTVDPLPTTAQGLPQTGAFRNLTLPPIDSSTNLTQQDGMGTPPPPRRSSAKTREHRVHFGRVHPAAAGAGAGAGAGEDSFSPRLTRTVNFNDNRPSTMHGLRDIVAGQRKSLPQELQSAMHIRGQGSSSSAQFPAPHIYGQAKPASQGGSRPANRAQQAAPVTTSLLQMHHNASMSDEDADGGPGQLRVNASAAPVGSGFRHRSRLKKGVGGGVSTVAGAGSGGAGGGGGCDDVGIL